MYRHLLVGLIGLASTPWTLQETEKVDLRFEGKTTTFTIKGACSVGSDNVSCWLPDGMPDKDLTAKVQSSLSKLKNVPAMRVEPGKRARLVVLETIYKPSNEHQQYEVVGARGRQQETWTQQIRSENIQEGDETTVTTTSLYGINVEPGDTTGSIYLRLPKDYLGTKRLEPEIGSTCEVLNWKFVLKKLSPLPAEGTREQQQKMWALELQVTGPSNLPTLQFYCEDRQHKYIQYVNHLGRPVAPEKHMEDTRKGIDKSNYTYLYPTKLDGEKIVVKSNVDPALMGGIGVSATVDRWVEITGFEVEPKATGAGR